MILWSGLWDGPVWLWVVGSWVELMREMVWFELVSVERVWFSKDGFVSSMVVLVWLLIVPLVCVRGRVVILSSLETPVARSLTRRENIESVHCLRDFCLDFWRSGFQTTASVRDPSTTQVCWSALDSKGKVWFEASIALSGQQLVIRFTFFRSGQ